MRRAEALRDRIRREYPAELRRLRAARKHIERIYLADLSRESFNALQAAVGDELSCELALEHVDAVAAEIVSGEIQYEEREQREFAGAMRERMDAIVAASRQARGVALGTSPREARVARSVDAVKRRNAAVLRLVEIGLRPCEIGPLDLAHVDLDAEGGPAACVPGAFRSGPRTVRLDPETVGTLRLWIEARGDAPGPLFLCSRSRGAGILPGMRRMNDMLVCGLLKRQGIRSRCARKGPLPKRPPERLSGVEKKGPPPAPPRVVAALDCRQLWFAWADGPCLRKEPVPQARTPRPARTRRRRYSITAGPVFACMQ